MIELERRAEGVGGSGPCFAHESEAQFARILDFYGVAWQYEPRMFPLLERGDQLLSAFTPDFYLPEFDLYIELTMLRQQLVTAKNRKLRQLRQRYPEVRVRLLYRRDVLKLMQRFGQAGQTATSPRLDRVLFDAPAIQQRVAELGAQITRDYTGERPVLIGVMRGAACFLADLMRQIALPLTVDFLSLSSYRPDRGPLRFTKDIEESIEGRRVLVVEDIVDTGMTLTCLLRHLAGYRPAEVRVCALLDKRARRLVDVKLDYVGFAIEDEFVAGYGLDFCQDYRNLPHVAALCLDEA